MTTALLTQSAAEQSVASEFVVRNPATGAEIGRLPLTPADAADAVLNRARAAVPIAAGLSRRARAEMLERTSRALEERTEQFAAQIVAEAGKTIRQARKEVARAVTTLALSAAEARRGGGEVIPFDAYAGGEQRQGWFTREPLGIVLAITPYNDALNLVAHKIGPAIAGGNAVILKPAQQTPYSARLLVELLREHGLPEDVVTVVHGDRHLTGALIAARDVRMVSFTGGFRTGEAITRTAGIKRLAMELGGNAPVIVFADADLKLAVEAIVSGAFWAAGQNCVGAQRILVHDDLYTAFREEFVAQSRALRTGDPSDERTDVGPMISEAAARTAADAVLSAVAGGARVLCGGVPDGPYLPPTVVERVPRDHSLYREEIFAPVAVLERFSDYAEAIDRANEVEYALHAGVFTRDLSVALRAAADIEAGGVMINDSSDYRIDAMPFGGAKYGSMGREGVRFAYEEMTQPKVVCIS